MATKINGYECEKCGHIEIHDFKKCPSCGWPYEAVEGWVSKNTKPDAKFKVE
jgi:rubredoxin